VHHAPYGRGVKGPRDVVREQGPWFVRESGATSWTGPVAHHFVIEMDGEPAFWAVLVRHGGSPRYDTLLYPAAIAIHAKEVWLLTRSSPR
jgi:hypothetical protein